MKALFSTAKLVTSTTKPKPSSSFKEISTKNELISKRRFRLKWAGPTHVHRCLVLTKHQSCGRSHHNAKQL
ncbi:hypothetical protein OIU77_018295, partial [Salix suchowensis]